MLIVGITFSKLYQAVYHDYASAQHNAAREDKFKEQCSGIASVVELRRCFEDKISSYGETQRAQEDLKAQKEMADWTFWILILTAAIGFPSLGLTGLGVVLVYWNLKEARNVTKQAIKATGAAVDQADTANKQFIALHRPKLILRYVQSGELVVGKTLEARLTFVNVGDTDAIISEFGGDIAFKVGEKWQPPGLNAEIEGLKSPIKIEPGSRVSLPVCSTAEVSEQRVWDIDGNNIQTVLIGEVAYKDLLGVVRHTGFYRVYEHGQFHKIRHSYEEYEYED